MSCLRCAVRCREQRFLTGPVDGGGWDGGWEWGQQIAETLPRVRSESCAHVIIKGSLDQCSTQRPPWLSSSGGWRDQVGFLHGAALQ